jgi:hypothetical protein
MQQRDLVTESFPARRASLNNTHSIQRLIPGKSNGRQRNNILAPVIDFHHSGLCSGRV